MTGGACRSGRGLTLYGRGFILCGRGFLFWAGSDPIGAVPAPLGAWLLALGAGPDSPVEASMAALSSLFSFLSWLRRSRSSCFLLLSCSSCSCSRRASASTRFFPYLHSSAPAAGGAAGDELAPCHRSQKSADLPELLPTLATPLLACFWASGLGFHGNPLAAPFDALS